MGFPQTRNKEKSLWKTWMRYHNCPLEIWHFHLSLSCTGEGNGNLLQCFCLENPRDGGAWWVAVYGVAQSRIWLKQLSSSSSRVRMMVFPLVSNSLNNQKRVWCGWHGWGRTKGPKAPPTSSSPIPRCGPQGSFRVPWAVGKPYLCDFFFLNKEFIVY